MNSSTEVFNRLYKKLNDEQKKAVDAIEGPVMVIAGPGTGKTSILTLRIANILYRTDTAPESVLALTFTESGVYSMRKKLVDIIGSAGYKVSIYTFHGFCQDIIKTYPEAFPRIIGSNNITDIDQIRIMENIILGGSDTLDVSDTVISFDKLKPYGDPHYYVRPALSAIQALKREAVSVLDFKNLVKKQKKDFQAIYDLYYEKGAYKGKMNGKYKDLEKNILKNEELMILYEEYENQLEKNKLYDYEDMIVEVIKILKKDADLLLRLQEKYQYFLADEHQDANNAQNAILELLASFHDNPNIFIVGDEKQAIFRFQGASLDNFLYFQKLYENVVLVKLKSNYRSHQTILDSAYSLISKNSIPDESLRIPLEAQGEDVVSINEKILLYSFHKSDDEYRFLAEDIRKKIKQGIKPSHIAVLYRNNKDVFPVVKVFEKTDLPFSIESDQDIFQDEDMRKLILLLRAINNLGDDALLAEALYIDLWGIESLSVYKLIHFARKQKISLYSLIKSEKLLAEVAIPDASTVHSLYKKLSAWSTLSHNKGFLDLFENVVRQSGFLTTLLAREQAIDKMLKLDAVFEQARNLIESHKEYQLKDFISYLDLLNQYHVLVKAKGDKGNKEAVRLMTAHKSKGLEFDYVYIIGAVDKHWGNKREINHFHLPLKGFEVLENQENDDERRLFYVALTRARKGVTITYSLVESGHSSDKQNLPSVFIEEIDKQFINEIEREVKSNEDQIKNISSKFDSALPQGPSAKDKVYLQKVFLEQGLSVTALNNYLDCPWNYFFTNLVRIPQSPSMYQMYGTAVHQTLKHYFDHAQEEKDKNEGKEEKSATAKTMLDLFQKYLNRQALSSSDFETLKKKGLNSLSGFFNEYHSSWTPNVITEFSIAGIFLPILPMDALDGDEGPISQVLLKGNIDKIEMLERGNEVNVVDYKTSKPITRNEILGLTKNANGNYRRQLIFYKILLYRYENQKFKMISGEIDFTEPDEKGNYHKERFEVTEGEVKGLEKTISQVAGEIYNFTFWDKSCKKRDCPYCEMKKVIVATEVISHRGHLR
jgi:DNA helicase-2/ATP-dependent DNA helicase PcrA